MQIAIDLDDDIAQGIIEGNNDEPRNIVRSFQATIADAIKNGTPLPKGHGQLVDFDELCKTYWDGNYMEIHKDDLQNIQTIIEADKEESEE